MFRVTLVSFRILYGILFLTSLYRVVLSIYFSWAPDDLVSCPGNESLGTASSQCYCCGPLPFLRADFLGNPCKCDPGCCTPNKECTEGASLSYWSGLALGAALPCESVVGSAGPAVYIWLGGPSSTVRTWAPVGWRSSCIWRKSLLALMTSASVGTARASMACSLSVVLSSHL